MLAIVTAADFPELPVGATIPMGETGYDMWMVAQLNMARHKVHWVGSRWRAWRPSMCTSPRPRWP